MYYDRTISDDFGKLLCSGGELRWLFDFVKTHDCLDFLIGRNDSKEWISVYRGLSRILTISPLRNGCIKLNAAEAYKQLQPKLYEAKTPADISQDQLEHLLEAVINDPKKFKRYYENKKEGYYQNELSRKFGICGSKNTDFVILDKEAVIGYQCESEKVKEYNPLQAPYIDWLEGLSKKDSKRYGSKLNEKPLGNELDFLALNRDGEILLIEYKHGSNTDGIYRSPFQIGLYYDLFKNLGLENLNKAVRRMFEQKQRIGLIHPEWEHAGPIKGIKPVLIISEKHTPAAQERFYEVMGFIRERKDSAFLSDLEIYNYTKEKGLTGWEKNK